jgi:hypothetical protein
MHSDYNRWIALKCLFCAPFRLFFLIMGRHDLNMETTMYLVLTTFSLILPACRLPRLLKRFAPDIGMSVNSILEVFLISTLKKSDEIIKEIGEGGGVIWALGVTRF